MKVVCGDDMSGDRMGFVMVLWVKRFFFRGEISDDSKAF